MRTEKGGPVRSTCRCLGILIVTGSGGKGEILDTKREERGRKQKRERERKKGSGNGRAVVLRLISAESRPTPEQKKRRRRDRINSRAKSGKKTYEEMKRTHG